MIGNISNLYGQKQENKTTVAVLNVRINSASSIAIQMASKYSRKTDFFFPILDKANLIFKMKTNFLNYDLPKTT